MLGAGAGSSVRRCDSHQQYRHGTGARHQVGIAAEREAAKAATAVRTHDDQVAAGFPGLVHHHIRNTT